MRRPRPDATGGPRRCRPLAAAPLRWALATGIALAAVPAAVVGAQPAAPEARPGWWITPTVRAAGVRQDAFLLTNDTRDGSTFARMVSSLEASFRSPRRIFDVGYALDGERYSGRLSMLNAIPSQQLGVVRYETRRGGVVADARLITTTRPEEVLDATGLVAAYRTTTNATINAAVATPLAPRWQRRFAYAFAFNDYGDATASRPSARGSQHALTTSLVVQTTPRSIVAVEQQVRLLIGEDLTVDRIVKGTFWDGHVGVRWTYNVTPRVRLVALAAPRVVQTLPRVINPTGVTPLRVETLPEIHASITRRDGARVLSATVARTAIIGFGASGFILTDSAEVRASTAISPRLRASVRGGLFRNALGTLTARSYRVEGTAIYDVSRWLSIEASYVQRYQNRGLTLADFGTEAPERPRLRRTVQVALALARPTRIR